MAEFLSPEQREINKIGGKLRLSYERTLCFES